MHLKASEYWSAAQMYRTASDPEMKHQARVALIGLALGNDRVSKLAANLLRTEGLAVIKVSVPRDVKAV